MKIKSLYIKILLAFLGVLLVTEIMILALFIGTAGRSFKHEFEKQSLAKLMIFREAIEGKLETHKDLEPSQNTEFKDFLATFSQLFDVDIWVTDTSEKIVFKTAEIPENIEPKRGFRTDITYGDIHLKHLSRRHLSYYAQIQISHQELPYVLHLYLNKEREKKPEAVFFVGLLIIGCVIALMVIPLTRAITRRVKALNDTALAFARGDLQARARIKGHDEIAGLGASFNLMAERIGKMIKGSQQLMANVSHELRSPLTRIRVSKELIAERLPDPLDRQIRNYIRNIDQDIDTLDHLIDQILKLSKMDYQESVGAVRPIEVGPFLSGIEKKYAPVLEHKQIAIARDVRPGLYVRADEQELATIFSNLFDNAVKYTQSHNTIQLTADPTPSGTTVVTMANPCRHLTGDELEHLFDPFARLKTSEETGSGLGLTIVKKLVLKNKGTIKALNTETGLMFKLEFPN